MRFNSPNMNRKAVEATDFLRRNDRLAALLPAAQRMGELQRDCAEALPLAFKFCEIIAYDGEGMVLSTPNTAVAAKLKQQLPKLQDCLNQKGWQINNIRLKVQMMKSASEAPIVPRVLALPEMAVDSFEELSNKLEPSAQNETLIAALRAMVARRRNP